MGDYKMTGQRFYILVLLCLVAVTGSTQLSITSPDSKIRVDINTSSGLSYSVRAGSSLLMENNKLALQFEGLKQSALKLSGKKTSFVDELVKPVVPLKSSVVVNRYNLLRLDFSNKLSIEFRVYNDGVAYRFLTSMKDSVNVLDETATFNLPASTIATWSPAETFKNDYQVIYKKQTIAEIPDSSMSVLPVIFDRSPYKLLMSEAGLHDYPAMFLQRKAGGSISATFPRAPVAFGDDGDRSVKIEKEAAYIARTTGTRAYPWRYFMITENDGQMIEHNLVTRLSGLPSGNFDWVKPGQVMWEWWHDARVYGVDFKSGYNQDTYKYYIDFASAHGIPYILMDEGWAATTMDPFTPNPTIRLKELIEYGKKKNVRIWLWFTWLAVERNFDVFKTLHDWGIAGMKIDFMDRSDQWMVNYYERVAKEAARNGILVDFHGAFKPAGLEHIYPNVLSYEGVVGMEGNIYGGIATTENNVYLPFLRNAVGPMDYTPGAMFSAHAKDYTGSRTNTMSIGTRAHQLAMYVVFESGLQMLADNPYNYLREPDALKFITSVPVTWDETKSIAAMEGEYVLIAKRKQDTWFVGGLTNSTARELELNTNFLLKDRSYAVTIIKDGVNADVQAMDYKLIRQTIKTGEKIPVSMVSEGGYAAVFELIK